MQNDKEFSFTELLIVYVIIVIIATITIPRLRLEKVAANEASAISSVHNIVNSQIIFLSTSGSGSYTNLASLSDYGLIDSTLESGAKDGYTFVLSARNTDVTFTVNAQPSVYGITGIRSFFANESGVIRYNRADDQASSNSPPLDKSN